ncbi:hypothetical protein CSUI_010160 [Cystoisospora suis]|uniref:Uncharacterized protein n=1 Tax=Cystoisospora suis TaxID=483139 RepID=A0A2C6KER2_9APIC|nr:hypothetical protein CSUI_010160 [Cystoisospora suis]
MIRPGLTDIDSVVVDESNLAEQGDLQSAAAVEVSLPSNEFLTAEPAVERGASAPASDTPSSEISPDEPVSTQDPPVSSIKTLGLSAFEQAGEAFAIVSPAEPIDLLRDRLPLHDDTVVSDGRTTAPLQPVSETLQLHVPVKVLVPHKAPTFESAERSYAKHIAALERQSKEYSKLVKKAARSTGKRKRYAVSESAETPAPWWMKSVSLGTSAEPREAAIDSEADTEEADAKYVTDEVILQRRLDAPWGRIFGLSLVPKKLRDNEKRGGSPPSAVKGNQRKAREERDPVVFPGFRTKQQERVAAREEISHDNEDRRSKEKRTQRKKEPAPAPQQHRQRHHDKPLPPPQAYTAQAEALDEDDFDELYDEDDFEVEDYEEEIRPQAHQTMKKPSAYRRNAQATYDYYLPDVYASPPITQATYADAASTTVLGAESWPTSAYSVARSNVDVVGLSADEETTEPSSTNGKKPLFSRKKSQASEAEAPAPLSSANRQGPLTHDSKKLLGRMRHQPNSESDERHAVNLDMSGLVASARPFEHHQEMKADNVGEKRKSGERPKLRERKSKPESD